MAQLPLDIKPRLSYTAENFVVHEGVADLLKHSLALLKGGRFQALFIMGKQRSGKTHLAVRLVDELRRRRLQAELIEGRDFETWVGGQAGQRLCAVQCFVVDDAHLYLGKLSPSRSGELVNVIEKMRVAGSKLVLLSLLSLDAFSFDEHVRSRLLAGHGFEIGPPGCGDIKHLLRQMCWQRGVALSARKIAFLEKRLERSLSAIESFSERLLLTLRKRSPASAFSILQEAIHGI